MISGALRSTLLAFSCAIVCASGTALAAQGARTGDPEGSVEPTAESAMRVVVNPSGVELEPIAVPDLQCLGADARSCALLVSVLRNDLSMSGVFRVLDTDSYLAKATAPGTKPPFPAWFNVGARYLVQGNVRPGAKGPRVHLELHDVVQRKTMAFRARKLSRSQAGDATVAVHYHVNAFMKAVAGREGIFGSRILFVQKRAGRKDIMQIRFGDPRPRVRHSDGGINLLPSLKRGGGLLHTSFKEGKPDLYLNGKRLTHDEYQYRGARFAPDGQTIAASLDMGDGQSDIWLLDRDGTPLKNLTESADDEVSPIWSKSGSWITFVSNRTGGPQIYVVRPDGTGLRRVSMAGEYNTSPEFGKGGRIVFSGMDEFVYDIFTTDLSGSMTRVTQQQGSNRDPAWSPDGRYIVFVTTRNRKTQLFVATEDGRWQHELFSAPGHYSTPIWYR